MISLSWFLHYSYPSCTKLLRILSAHMWMGPARGEEVRSFPCQHLVHKRKGMKLPIKLPGRDFGKSLPFSISVLVHEKCKFCWGVLKKMEVKRLTE